MTRDDYHQGIRKNILSFLEQKLEEEKKFLSELNNVIPLDFSSRIVNEQIQINLSVNVEGLKKSIELLNIGSYGICKVCLNKITYEELLTYPYKTTCGDCISQRQKK